MPPAPVGRLNHKTTAALYHLEFMLAAVGRSGGGLEVNS